MGRSNTCWDYNAEISEATHIFIIIQIINLHTRGTITEYERW